MHWWNLFGFKCHCQPIFIQKPKIVKKSYYFMLQQTHQGRPKLRLPSPVARRLSGQKHRNKTTGLIRNNFTGILGTSYPILFPEPHASPNGSKRPLPMNTIQQISPPWCLILINAECSPAGQQNPGHQCHHRTGSLVLVRVTREYTLGAREALHCIDRKVEIKAEKSRNIIDRSATEIRCSHRNDAKSHVRGKRLA